MKNISYIIVFILLSLSTVFAQKVATHTLTNFNVNTLTNKLSFDIYSQRTGDTFIRVGLTSYLISFNSAVLNTPVISNVNPKYTTSSVTGDYDVMTVETSLGNKVNITIHYTGATSGTGDLLSTSGPMGELICTVTLNIAVQSVTTTVSWDTINSAMTDANILQPVTDNYSGSFDSPLPVELSSFNAKTIENSKVKLNWKTQTEIDNYGFDIERCVSGKESQWTKVGFIEGHGNSNSPKEYSFLDGNPTGGSKYLYRLKQVDNDGRFEYSAEVEVDVLPSQYSLSQNYPNPFNPTTKINFSLPEKSSVRIVLYNSIGEEVSEILNSEYEPGVYNVDLNASALSSGVYFYRIQTPNFSSVKKMILLR